MVKRTTAACAFGAVMVVAWGAFADTIHVPGDYPTIQEAIVAANNGDEICVAPGTYNETIDFIGKAVRLYSTDGPEVTVIDAENLDNRSVVWCVNGEGPDTVLEGFTITGGVIDFGGGMLNFESSPTVTNCTFIGNSALDGGGMLNFESSPTVTNCTFIGNTGARGGGMFNYVNSSPALTNCTFTGNESVEGGGGMLNTINSSPTVTGCTFSNNTASGGGGMFNLNNSSPTVTNCTFAGNNAQFGRGGGIYSVRSNPPVAGSSFCGNDPDNISGPWTDEGGNEFMDECPCPADLDADGLVGFGDLLLLLAAWGNEGGLEDLDGSGVVDFGDIVVLLAGWGHAPSELEESR